MNPRVGGILFIAAGIASFGAAILEEQRTFYGVGVAFIAIGIALLVRVGRNMAR